MKFTKKALIMTICLALIAGTAVFGTVAYLTDTAEVTNTFSVGEVDITLDETLVNENGEPVDNSGTVLTDPETFLTTENGNEYLLIPGCTYTKDPAITVSENSQPAFYRMLVTINNYADLNRISQRINGVDFLPQNFVNGWDETVWPCVGMTPDTTNDTMTYEFRYVEDPANPIDTSAGDVELPALFESFTLPGKFTNQDLKDINDPEFKIVVVGHAMQQVGFEGNVDAAWAAFDEQNPSTNP